MAHLATFAKESKKPSLEGGGGSFPATQAVPPPPARCNARKSCLWKELKGHQGDPGIRMRRDMKALKCICSCEVLAWERRDALPCAVVEGEKLGAFCQGMAGEVRAGFWE